MAEPAKQQRVSPKAKKGMGLAGAIALIISAVFAVEGGYVDHPDDPGGATNHGITERVARDHGYTGDMRDLERECPLNVAIEDRDGEPQAICANTILYESYIEKPGFVPLVQIDPVVAEEVIDTAVNMGPSRPIRFFQRSVNDVCGTGLAVDGKLGPRSWTAWRDCRYNVGKSACADLLETLDAYQEAEYDRLVRVNPRLRSFRRGWQNHRIGNVDRDRCGELLPFERAA